MQSWSQSNKPEETYTYSPCRSCSAKLIIDLSCPLDSIKCSASKVHNTPCRSSHQPSYTFTNTFEEPSKSFIFCPLHRFEYYTRDASKEAHPQVSGIPGHAQSKIILMASSLDCLPSLLLKLLIKSETTTTSKLMTC